MKRVMIAGILLLAAGCASLSQTTIITASESKTVVTSESKVTRYARFRVHDREACGIVAGDVIHEIDGDFFGDQHRTGRSYRLSEVKLLVPTKPSKVLAMAGNYVSHLSQQPAPKNPELFFKPPSCLISQGEAVILPQGSATVHLEGEMVIVIGRRARNVPEAQALQYVLGVTCGNDISARDWQANDKQWWRAKGCDTFGPCGPFIVSGVNYDDLTVTSRVNGKITQQQRTKDMVFNCSQIVSFASRHLTLEPGDLIFTGTMGQTPAIRPGDVPEVEVEHVGILKNPVMAEPGK
jgi:2-keto-4-pentenoate hydratase/2-oxohepta-3-ene-1,7-dioic acid hydratase in catechol pathway